MGQFLIILRYKLQAGLKRVFRLRFDAITRDFASVVVLSGFAIGIFFFGRFITSYLIYDAKIGLFLFHRFASMILFVFFLAINLGNLVVAYSTLYKSEEVGFLFTLPISSEKIFIVKFLDNFFHSSSTLFLIGLAVLAGYGSVFELSWTTYVLILLGLILPFMLLAAGIAVIILLGFMKLAARISLRRLIAGLLLLYLVFVFAFFRIMNPVRLTEQVMKFYPNVNEYFSQFDPKIVTYLPNHWVADSLLFLVRGELDGAIPYIQLLVLSMFASLITCGLLAYRLYYPTWLSSRELRLTGRGNRRFAFRLLDFQSPSPLQVQTEVLLKKDFWQFFREPSQWVHLLIMIFLVVVFIVSISNVELKMSIPFLQTVSYVLVMIFNGFLVASIALRFVFPAISMEGQSFWSIRTSPIRMGKIYWLKFLVSFVLVLIVAELLSVFSNYPLHRYGPLLITAVASSFCLTLGLVALTLGAGGLFANYREKNAIRVASSPGASLTFLIGLAFLSVIVITLFIPLHQYFEFLILKRGFLATALNPALLVIFGISIVVFCISSFLGLHSLHKDF